MTTLELCSLAKAAAPSLLKTSDQQRNHALFCMAEALVAASDDILSANAADIKDSTGIISDVMIDRLMLNKARIEAMADGIRTLISLPSPAGRVVSEAIRPNGLKVQKVLVPFGVIAIIYESRPNVTSDAAALCIKSSNACVLRSGKEAHRSAKAIVDALKRGLESAGLSPDLIVLIEDTSRASAAELMTANDYIDLLIPRGGRGLINACIQNASVPCIATGTGICHIFVDASADIDTALQIINNAKTSRPSVCNAEEVLLVDKSIASDFLPRLETLLVDNRIADGKQPVKFLAGNNAMPYLKTATPANSDDFDTEFLDYILAIDTVDSIESAISHINEHSTGHSEAIITQSPENAALFSTMIDSSAVYINASTRFTDGGEFGFGCEMGISTQKLHARGPMGLDELNTYKYVITGNGQIR